MKQITTLVLAVLIGVAIGVGMGTQNAQQPCASPSPSPSVAGEERALVQDLTLPLPPGSGITIATPTSGDCVEAEFEPAPDITAYELAQLLPYITQGECMTECEWKEAGALTRHLKRKVKEPGQ
jgi:hypothetical protein